MHNTSHLIIFTQKISLPWPHYKPQYLSFSYGFPCSSESGSTFKEWIRIQATVECGSKSKTLHSVEKFWFIYATLFTTWFYTKKIIKPNMTLQR
jgi:hypothetical protein